MPHAIPKGAVVRRDAELFTRLVLCHVPAPDMEAAAAIPYDKPEYLAELRAAVAADKVGCLGFMRGGEVVGQLFYHLENGDFRIHGAHAMPGLEDGEAWAACMPMIEAHARRVGCVSITTDTSRPGVLRAHIAGGFRVAETILTKAL